MIRIGQHEAGHAVVMLELFGDVGSVRAHPVFGGSTSFGEAPADFDPHDLATVFAAGVAAEVMAGADLDEARARSAGWDEPWLSYHLGWQYPDADRLPEDLRNRNFREHLDRATGILTARATEMRRLAAVLDAGAELSSWRVGEIAAGRMNVHEIRRAQLALRLRAAL